MDWVARVDYFLGEVINYAKPDVLPHQLGGGDHPPDHLLNEGGDLYIFRHRTLLLD